MASRDLTVRLIGDSSDLERDLKRTRKQLEWTQKDLQRLKEQARKSDAGLRAFGRSGSVASKGLRDVGKGAAYALGAGGFGGGMYALFDITKKSVEQFKESERVSRQTAAALKSTGAAAGISAKGVNDLANSLKKKTAIDDEAIQASENLLLTFTNIRNVTGKNNDIFNQATKATLDMSTAMNHGATPSVEKLHNASILIGKALNDPIAGMTALRRVGVQLTQQQLDQIKVLVRHGKGLQAQKIILGELTKEFGGSAAKQATAAKRLSTSMNDIAESIGRKVNPALKAGAGWLNNFIQQMQTGKGEGGHFAKSMRSVGDSLETVWSAVKPVAQILAKVLVPALTVVTTALKIQIKVWAAIEGAIFKVYTAIVDKLLGGYSTFLDVVSKVASAARHLPGIGGWAGEVSDDAKKAANEINKIREAVRALPGHKTIHIDVVANDPGVVIGDNKPAGRGGAPKTPSSQRSIVDAAARQYHISSDLLWGVYGVETGHGSNVKTSSAGAKGAFQFMPGTAPGYNYPYTNNQSTSVFTKQALGAAHYLSDLLKQKHGDVAAALLAYSGGGYSSVPGFSGSGTVAGNFNKGASTKKKVAGAGPKIEQMSLDSALSFIRKNFPGAANSNTFIEDKGLQNQHLHISDANHKELRNLARALVSMGYSVGEYGGKPIPGVGGITTLKHKHYGPTDHYSGGAVDVNSDGELIKAYGIAGKKQKGKKIDNVFHAPSITQSDFMSAIDAKLNHFDLEFQAGLISATKAALLKRKFLSTMLASGALTGDAALQALIMLKGLPAAPKTLTAVQKTWSGRGGGRDSLAMAYGALNPEWLKNYSTLKPGFATWAAGLNKGMPVDKTINNPWLQAALGHTDTMVAAGELNPAQADALKKGYLTNALLSATGDDARQIKAALKEIADNTLDTANNLRVSTIDSAGFFGGLNGPGAGAVSSVLNANGITTLPDGTPIAPLIGSTSATGELAKGDIGALMQEVRNGQKTLTDVWPQIQSDLGTIAGATAETAANTQQQVDALKEELARSRRATATASATGAAVLDYFHGEITKKSGTAIQHGSRGAGTGIARLP